ncbi:MAG TPA: restriction endonuclease [Longimicrobium sp.]|nr:restriction endonuclease [Longimicrobium sp.]
MTRATDYAARIRALDWEGLRDLWDRSARGTAAGWPPGKAFEYLILRAFELDGAVVRFPFEVTLGDAVIEQIDGVVYSGHLSCLIEAKDTADPVDVGALAKIRTQLARRPGGTLGAVFSRSGFTDPAVALAGYFAPHAVLLWSGEEVTECLQERNISSVLLAKFRECVEHGGPKTVLWGKVPR